MSATGVNVSKLELVWEKTLPNTNNISVLIDINARKSKSFDREDLESIVINNEKHS